MAQSYTRQAPKSDTKPKAMSQTMQMVASTPVEYTDKATGEMRTSWTKCGSWFETEKAIIVNLNSLPVNGKLVLSKFEKEN